MAKLRAGILGNVRGKVSGVVGAQWKDINYVREYVKPANPNTTLQQDQRSKMSRCVEYAKYLVGPVFNAYTDKFIKSMSGFNYFIKNNIVHFLTTPIWNLLVLTTGKLWFGGVLAATYSAVTGYITVSWDTSLGNNGSADDGVYGAIYDVVTGFWYFPDAETSRSFADVVVHLPAGLEYTHLRVWFWAAKYDRSVLAMISNSSYHVVDTAG
jgi:hypothetical protein